MNARVGAEHNAGAATLHLRPERPDDLQFLFDLYASTRADELDLTGWDSAARANFLTMQFSAQQSHYRTHHPQTQFDIVELDGLPVGRLYVRRGDREVVLMDIALLPAFRNKGIGSELLGALIDESVAARKVLTLHVETNNPRAHAWYTRFGFVDVSTDSVHILMQREPRDR